MSDPSSDPTSDPNNNLQSIVQSVDQETSPCPPPPPPPPPAIAEQSYHFNSKMISHFWASFPKFLVSPSPSGDMIESYHMLELIGVSHTGPVISSSQVSCWSRVTGSVSTALILKDVSLEVHSGEVMAILGSKGSGKKALMDIIGHRISQGVTKGQILLNDVPLTGRLFQEQCGFVPTRVQLIPGLTVRQMLYYTSRMTLKTSNSMRRQRLKQVMADVALTSVQHVRTEHLNISEATRLKIALQMMRDPLLLMVEDATLDLDPLNAYFVVSLLSNHAKKYGRLVVITLDKPRSDVFPFLDRVTFLCMGDVVYTGSTRMMMDYFSSIGFPCPESENPLMYYLCLCTVDRRSRDRFLESSAQIAALVDKFKLEGNEYRKYLPPGSSPAVGGTVPTTIPLTAYGAPSTGSVALTLIGRNISCTLTMKHLFIRVLLLPLVSIVLFGLLLPRVGHHQQSIPTRSGLLFTYMAAMSSVTAAITAYSLSPLRNRFYEECSRNNLYRGPLFILTTSISLIPFTAISVALSCSLIYFLVGLRSDEEWTQRMGLFTALMFAVVTIAQQHTLSIMSCVRSPFRATLVSMTLLLGYLMMGSGSLRSLLPVGDSRWFQYINYGNMFYYVGWVLHFNEMHLNPTLDRPGFMAESGLTISCPPNVIPGRCLYLNGTHFLAQTYGQGVHWPEFSFHFWRNFALSFVFVLSSYALNVIVYLIPLPASLKAKFRD